MITPKFDDLLARSLSIFGAHHIVSDHPHTVDRIDLESDDIQIVHVHGSYLFYDCINLQEELEYRARPSPTSTKTMAAFLDRALSFRSPIVVGYAGWEGDVIMAALRRRLEGNSLPYRLYWCLYTSRDLEVLPAWLTEHNDVRLVIADDKDDRRAESTVDNNASGDLITARQDRPLTARVAFEELSRSFRLGEPELTKDPVSFLAKQLRASVYLGAAKEDTVYFFSDVIARVERAAELEKQDRKSKRHRPLAILGETGTKIRDAIRRSRYDEAIVSASSLDINKLTNEAAAELFSAFNLARAKGNAEGLKISDFVIRLGKRLVNTDNPESIKKFYAYPSIEKADILTRLDRPEDAIELLDEVVKRIVQLSPSQLEETALYASTRKALALGKSARFSDAVQLYDEIISRLKKIDTSFSRWLLSQSRFNRAVDLARASRVDEALTAYDKYVEVYRSAQDGWTQVLVASSLLDRAKLFRDLDRQTEALDEIETLLGLYKDSRHSQVSEYVSMALVLKKRILKSLNRSTEADEATGELRLRFEREKAKSDNPQQETKRTRRFARAKGTKTGPNTH